MKRKLKRIVILILLLMGVGCSKKNETNVLNGFHFGGDNRLFSRVAKGEPIHYSHSVSVKGKCIEVKVHYTYLDETGSFKFAHLIDKVECYVE